MTKNEPCFKAKGKTILLLTIIFISIFSMQFISSDLTTNLTYYYNFTTATYTLDATPNSHTLVDVSSKNDVGIIGAGRNLSGLSPVTLTNISNDATFSSNNFTVNIWVRPTATTEGDIIGTLTGGGAGWLITNYPGGTFKWIQDVDTAGYSYIFGGNYTLGEWKMLTVVRRGTNTSFWVDGSTQNAHASANVTVGTGKLIIGYSHYAANSFFGTIDEVAIANGYAWSDAEIAQAWNSGVGITYPFGGGGGGNSLTLISPGNNSNLIQSNYSFVSNSTITGATLKNTTLEVYNITGLLFTNSTTISGTSSVSNLSLSNIPFGSYSWNYKTYFTNGSYMYALSNKTFIESTFITNSVTYNATTTESKTETFILNITKANPSASAGANLFYNGIDMGSATTQNLGGNTIFTSTFQIPLGTASGSFYWDVISTGTQFNSTIYNQTVNGLNLGKCNSTLQSVALNFTTKSEVDQTNLTGFNFYGTFYYSIGSGTLKKNISISEMNVDSESICLSSNDTYTVDADIQYEKSSFIKRSYYFTQEPVMNNSRSINLYLLNSSLSTSFIINILDKNQLAIPNAYIYEQRYYPGTNTFQTVEMGLTDNTGSTVGNFEAETEDYKILIEQNNQFIYSGPTQKIFCSVSPCTLTIQTTGQNNSQWVNLGSVSNFTYTLNYSNTTKIWTMTYADTSGHLGSGRFWVYTINGQTGPVTICNVSSVAVSDILTCDLTNQNGTIYGAVYLSRSPERLVYLDTVVKSLFTSTYGMEGLFLSFLVLLTLGLAGLWNPVVGIVLVVVGMIVLSITGLATFGAVTIWGIIFVAILAIWELNH